MRIFLFAFAILTAISSYSQTDTGEIATLSRQTILSEVVIRNDLNVNSFLLRVKNDSTFYKAFKNLRILGFTSLNDIRMLNKSGTTIASLNSKTRQYRSGNCRNMEVLEQRSSGDFFDKSGYNYYTADLYASLFFTNQPVCGETNIVAGIDREVRSKKGLEKNKEQLKMLFFNPGKKIPGIPFIGDKIDIFSPDVAKNYEFSIDMDEVKGENCYVFKIAPKSGLSSSQRNDIVFDNITTWFNAKTMEIVARNYDLSYDTPAYDFKVHVEVKMTRWRNLLVPELLIYNGNWKVAFKKRERGVFTATLYNYE